MAEISHVKHPAKSRNLTVAQKYNLSPNMLRIIFAGEDLKDLVSLAPDDNIKILGKDGIKRSYTPRAFDNDRKELTIDFALHKIGVVTNWAKEANIGDKLEISGPNKSVITKEFDWYLLVGDETALPSIARRLEELESNIFVITICMISGENEEINFQTNAKHTDYWLYRSYNEADKVEDILKKIKELNFPKGDGFIWISAEAKIACTLREYVIKERGHPAQWVKSTAYWVKGENAMSMRIEDDI